MSPGGSWRLENTGALTRCDAGAAAPHGLLTWRELGRTALLFRHDTHMETT